MGIFTPEEEQILSDAVARKGASLDHYVDLFRAQAAENGEAQAMVAMTTGFAIALDRLSAIGCLAVAIQRLAALPEPAQSEAEVQTTEVPVGV